MNKFISFILDEKKVRDYFGTYFKVFFILLVNSIFISLSIITILYLNKIFEFGNTKVINQGTQNPEVISYMDYGETPFFLLVFITLYFFYIIKITNKIKSNKKSIFNKIYISINLLIFCLLLTSLTHLGSFFVANIVYYFHSIALNIKIKSYLFKDYKYLTFISISPIMLLMIKFYITNEILNTIISIIIFPFLYIILFKKIFLNSNNKTI